MSRWFTKNKYGNKRSGEFGSRFEDYIHEQYKLREMAGEIKILKTQEQIVLVKTRRGKKIIYKPDFTLLDLKTNEIFWGEAKGFETDTWRLKRTLWELNGPGLLEVFQGRIRSYTLEILLPDTYEGGLRNGPKR